MIPRKIVVDTSVLVAAMRSGTGASAALLRECLAGNFRFFATATLFFEYEAVLTRRDHGLDPAIIEKLLRQLALRVEAVHIDFQWKPQLTDPDDELVLEAATNGMVEAIVTHNIRDFGPAIKGFGIAVLTPGAIMKMRRSNPWHPL